MKVKSLDISGMGGAYEQACQMMLRDGLEFIKDKPLSIWKGTHGYKGVTGILLTKSAELKALEKLWIERYHPSGAMHHAVMSHLFFIHKFGYEKWLEKGKDRIIEVELPEKIGKD